MRREVDVLTLSATPIPRTLHMALGGIRDMSTMETPPEERLPIKTYVSRVRRPADPRGDPARAGARRPGLLRAQPRPQHRAWSPRKRAGDRAGGAHRHRPRPDGRARAGAGDATSSRTARSTCWSARRSSSPASTSRTSTRSSSTRPTSSGWPSSTSCAAASAAAPTAPTPTCSTTARARLTETGQAAPADDLRGDGAGRRLPDRPARPGDPRRRQPAGRRAERLHGGRRLRPLRAACSPRRSSACGR